MTNIMFLFSLSLVCTQEGKRLCRAMSTEYLWEEDLEGFDLVNFPQVSEK